MSESHVRKVINEPDFLPLHVVRQLAQAATLVRVQRGKLVPTPLGKSILSDAKRGSLLAVLFHLAFWRMDLSYFGRGLFGSARRTPRPSFGPSDCAMTGNLSGNLRGFANSGRASKYGHFFDQIPDDNTVRVTLGVTTSEIPAEAAGYDVSTASNHPARQSGMGRIPRLARSSCVPRAPVRTGETCTHSATHRRRDLRKRGSSPLGSANNINSLALENVKLSGAVRKLYGIGTPGNRSKPPHLAASDC